MLGAGLETSLEACPTAALVLDAAGAIVFANAEAIRLFQRLPQKEVGDFNRL